MYFFPALPRYNWVCISQASQHILYFKFLHQLLIYLLLVQSYLLLSPFYCIQQLHCTSTPHRRSSPSDLASAQLFDLLVIPCHYRHSNLLSRIQISTHPISAARVPNLSFFFLHNAPHFPRWAGLQCFTIADPLSEVAEIHLGMSTGSHLGRGMLRYTSSASSLPLRLFFSLQPLTELSPLFCCWTPRTPGSLALSGEPGPYLGR